MSGQGIYLKLGDKTVGPYTEAEFRELRDQGELVKYTAIFRDPARGWEDLAPPPLTTAAPLDAPSADAPSAAPRALEPASAPRATRATARPLRANHPWEVVIHDFRQLVSGTVTQLTDFGCEITCMVDEGPIFSTEHPVELNILDGKTGASTCVKARLDRITRDGGHWIYRVLWDETPALLSA